MATTPTIQTPFTATPVPNRGRRFLTRLFRATVLSLAGAMLLELVLVITPVTEGLYRWLNLTQDPQPADAIVCLGGQYERLLWTARAYRQHYAPRIVVSNAPGAAEFMRDLLVACGVPRKDILVDNSSKTTADHPAGVAHIASLDPERDRLLIITNVEHSRRVAAVFRKAGWVHFSIYGGPLAPELAANRDSRPGDTEGMDPIHSHFKWRVQILPRLAYEYTALVQYWFQGKI